MATAQQGLGQRQAAKSQGAAVRPFLCNPQKKLPVSKKLGSRRQQAYLYLGEKRPEAELPDCYTRELLLKKPGARPFAIAKIQYKAGLPLWFEGFWDQDILGSATGKTIWQIKRAVLEAYRRQYKILIAHYQAQLEELKGIRINGEY